VIILNEKTAIKVAAYIFSCNTNALGGRWAIRFGVQEAICKIFLFVETVSTFVISIIVRSLLSFRCQHKMSTLPIYEVPHKSTHWLMAHENPTTPKYVNSPTYKLKNSSTHRFTSKQLTGTSTHKQTNFRSILAKILAVKWVNCHKF